MFNKHYKRFERESFIKAILLAAIISFMLMSIMALLFWFIDFTAFWLTIPLFAISTFGLGILFAKTKFKPKEKRIANTLDKLGLDERMITAVEFKDDNSFIAQLQRKDAVKHSTLLNSKQIKIAVSIPLIVGVVIMTLLFSSAVTANALSASDVIRSGKQIIADINTIPETYCNIYYTAEGGVILGEDEQLVKLGNQCSAVMAVPDYGFAFVKWSDGYTEPYRQDLNVSGDALLTAIFEPDKNVIEGSEYKDYGNMPYDPESEDGDRKRPQSWHEPMEDPDNRRPNKDSGEVSSNRGSTVLDGETDYGGKLYGEAVQDAIDQTSGNPNYCEIENDIIGDYLTGIKK